MTNEQTKPKVGLAKFAYRGAPKGVSHVWPEDLDLTAKPQWNFKTKRVRRLELIATM